MEAISQSKYVRISPRKLKLLVDTVKKVPLTRLSDTLSFMPQSGADILQKTLLSALANAKNKQMGGAEGLSVKSIEVLPAPAMKRFRAVSRGMAHSYKKRMSHVRIVLTEKVAKESVISKKLQVEKQEKIEVKNPESKK